MNVMLFEKTSYNLNYLYTCPLVKEETTQNLVAFEFLCTLFSAVSTPWYVFTFVLHSLKNFGFHKKNTENLC